VSERQEQWASYICEIDDGDPASIVVDLSFGPEAADPDRPWLIRVRLLCHEMDDNGLPTSEELAVLQDLEDRITEVIQAMEGPIHVGSVTTGGFREMILYVPEGFAGLDDESLDMVPENRRSDDFLMMAEDPPWDFYNTVLFPSADDLREISNDQVLQQLISQGDDLSAPRRIDHWIYFQDAAARTAFAAWATQNGFEIAELIEPDEERETPGIQIHHATAVEPDIIHELIGSIEDAATQFGGEYDGWETGLAGNMG
jgi:regulator of RNase E activity RraB